MSSYESFWGSRSFAVVGHSKKRSFPALTYRGLKSLGKAVFPVDPSVEEVDGDRAYPDLTSLPERPDAVVLELPKEETRDWVARVADAGIRKVWIHMNTDTPEALALAEEKGLETHSGTCAVMYVTPGFTFHTLHKWVHQLVGKY